MSLDLQPEAHPNDGRKQTSAEAAAWDSLSNRVTITLRPVGLPLSLGFFGLAAATLTLSGLQLGWVSVTDGRATAFALIGFAFVAQAIASVFAFLARDGTAGTAMAVLAGTWLVVALVMLDSRPGATSGSLGLLLLVSATAIGITGFTAAASKVVPGIVFMVAALRFAAVGVYELTSKTGWKELTGILGLVLFVLAIYAATAGELEAALGRTVLPMGRHGKGREALDGSLRDQIKYLPKEPGVRARL